jgi:hypothetical protein
MVAGLTSYRGLAARHLTVVDDSEVRGSHSKLAALVSIRPMNRYS